MIEETRMIPTEFLKSNLERVGFPVVWELWHPDFPFLVAYLDHSLCPQRHRRQTSAGLIWQRFSTLLHRTRSQARAGGVSMPDEFEVR